MRTKSCTEDLAFFGGKPAFPDKLHVGRPNVGSRERLLERLSVMLEQGWLTNNGPYVREFERRTAELIGVRQNIAVCNGTAALELVARALELEGEVIVPSFTFIATAHALQWQGITPVFCDIDPTTHSINPQHAESLITPRTTGIVGVHMWGKPCAVEELAEIAKRHDLKLIFDAAHAFACSHQGHMIGGFGHAEVFSFHATKFLHTFEGGGIATNDDELATRVRLMRNHGFTGYDRVACLGINYKMSEPSAAMGLTGLENLDDFIEHNCRNYQQYLQELENVPGIRVFRYNETEKCNYQYVVLEVNETASRLSRDDLLGILWAENVIARRYFYPGCHRMEPYCSRFPDATAQLPETEKVASQVLQLPTGTSVGPSEIRQVCRIIQFAIDHAPDLKKRMVERAALRTSGPR
jgi:dTDP-4-amino-4,6-dideoxygalactose transaminase